MPPQLLRIGRWSVAPKKNMGHVFFLLLLLLRLPAAASFVRLTQDANGAWWFTDGGSKFLSFSVNHVNNGGLDDGVGGREAAVCRAATGDPACGDSLNYGGALGYAPLFQVTQDKFGSEAAWAAATIGSLKQMGFNGISGWSHTLAERAAAAAGLYYFHLLDIGTTWPHSHEGLDWDAWSANFTSQCEAIAAAEVAPRANDPFLLAWQTDNENKFSATNLTKYLTTYGQGAGGAAAVAFLQGRYATLAALNAAWGVSAASWATLGAALPATRPAAFQADDADFIGLVVDRWVSYAEPLVQPQPSPPPHHHQPQPPTTETATSTCPPPRSEGTTPTTSSAASAFRGTRRRRGARRRATWTFWISTITGTCPMSRC